MIRGLDRSTEMESPLHAIHTRCTPFTLCTHTHAIHMLQCALTPTAHTPFTCCSVHSHPLHTSHSPVAASSARMSSPAAEYTRPLATTGEVLADRNQQIQPKGKTDSGNCQKRRRCASCLGLAESIFGAHSLCAIICQKRRRCAVSLGTASA